MLYHMHLPTQGVPFVPFGLLCGQWLAALLVEVAVHCRAMQGCMQWLHGGCCMHDDGTAKQPLSQARFLCAARHPSSEHTTSAARQRPRSGKQSTRSMQRESQRTCHRLRLPLSWSSYRLRARATAPAAGRHAMQMGPVSSGSTVCLASVGRAFLSVAGAVSSRSASPWQPAWWHWRPSHLP